MSKHRFVLEISVDDAKLSKFDPYDLPNHVEDWLIEDLFKAADESDLIDTSECYMGDHELLEAAAKPKRLKSRNKPK